MLTCAPCRYWRRTLGLQVRYADCGGYRFCYAYRGKAGMRPSILMLHGFSAHKDAWLTVVKVHQRVLLFEMERWREKFSSVQNVFWQKSQKFSCNSCEISNFNLYVLSCFDQVSTEASAHFVRGHARPRGNNTHQHRRLLHQGTGQEDSPGELLAAKTMKHALTDLHMNYFTEQ